MAYKTHVNGAAIGISELSALTFVDLSTLCDLNTIEVVD
jgi:hypothetical protein